MSSRQPSQGSSERYLRYGGRSLFILVILAFVVVGVNVLAARNPVQWDVTQNKVLSLAPETLRLLDRLEGPAELIGFFPQELIGYRENDVRPLLHQYFIQSRGEVTYHFIDPQENPAAALEYGEALSSNEAWMVVKYAGDFEVIRVINEIEITGALVRLLDPTDRVIYALTGHGEPALTSGSSGHYQLLIQALLRKRYEIHELNLLANPVIPPNARLILIVDPIQYLAQAEIDLLDEYLGRGGGLVVALEPSLVTEQDSSEDPLRGYLRARWGIDLHDDIVYEADLIPPFTAQGINFGSHEITLGLENSTTLFPTASSLGPTESVPEGIDRSALVGTSAQAWGETGLTTLAEEPEMEVSFDAQDYEGPLVVASAVEEASSRSRMVIFGDAEFFNDDYFEQFANGPLMLNAIDWTAHHEGLIGLSPSQTVARFILPPSQSRINAMFIGVVIVIPGLVVLAGILVWWSRRRRL